LKVMGIETVVAGDFDTAFNCIVEQAFDIITLDMQLDEMDTGGQHGMLLLDQLRTKSKDTKVIIVSALEWDGKQVRDFLIKYRASDYLKKPFDPGDLRHMIEEALGK
jgi:DNA-binding response OmpR family regulator